MSRSVPVALALACAALPSGVSASVERPRATWLHHRWLAGAAAQRDQEHLVSELSRLRITTVFPALARGPMRPIAGATRTSTRGWVSDLDAARRFVSSLRARIPGVRVIPYKGFRSCANLSTPTSRDTLAAALADSALAIGADGVQLDLECPELASPASIQGALEDLLARVDHRLGPDLTLSVALPMISPAGDLGRDPAFAGASWPAKLSALRDARPARSIPGRAYVPVWARADQIVMMIYDSGFAADRAGAYVELAAAQIEAGLWFAANANKELVLGFRISTIDEGRHHRHGAENPRNAALAIARSRAPLTTAVAYFRLDAATEPGTDPVRWRAYESALVE